MFLTYLYFMTSLWLGWSSAVHAWQGTRYTVRDNTEVYEHPKADSEVIHYLNTGDTVLVGGVASKKFRIIKFKLGQSIQQGYVLSQQIAGWDTVVNAVSSRKRVSAFVSLHGSYQRQGERALQTSADSTYSVSEFSGFSQFLAAGVDFPYGEEWAIRLGLIVRNSYMEGKAKPDNTSTQYQFSLDQDFIGASAGLRFRPKAWGPLSFMAGAEFSKGTRVELKVLDGPAVDSSEVKLPYFMIFSGAVLYDFKLSQNLGFEPGLNIGVVATADPVIVLAEGLVSVKYFF